MYRCLPNTHTGAGEDIREREVPTSASRWARQRRPEPFLRGPIPVRLIGAVLDLPGRPLPVLLAIWHRVAVPGSRGCHCRPTSWRTSVSTGTVKARALAELERAGLIRVKRTPGRPVLVSLASKRTEGGENVSGSIP